MKARKLFVVAATLFAAVTVFGQSYTIPTNYDGVPTQLMSTLPGTDVVAGVSRALSDDNTILTNDKIWIMDRRIYVDTLKSLTIQPGTIIKATPEQGPETRTLVISRGAKIYAIGTSEQPIVFTTIYDPLSNVTEGSDYSVVHKEKWGGVVILGSAYNSIEFGEKNPEDGSSIIGARNGLGYMEGLPSPNPRHWYGAYDWTDPGTPGEPWDDVPVFNDDDNSGVMKYVSIRHGGTEIASNNEINGLTCGSVGRGTVLEHIEVVSNGDDGIEFFGGTVDIKYANVLFCEDDYIDWDQGYSGRGQFIFGVQLNSSDLTGDFTADATYDDNMSDNGLECDGDDGPRVYSFSKASAPTFYNVTIVGDGSGDKALELKERTEGTIANSLFAQFGTAVALKQDGGTEYRQLGYDTNGDGDNDSLLVSDAGVDYPGAMILKNNLFLNTGAHSASASQVTQLATDNNVIVSSSSIIDDSYVLNTTLSGSYYTENVVDAFDAVPAAGTAEVELTAADVAPADGFFEYAPYIGAFEPGKAAWNDSWSKMEDVQLDKNTVDCPTDNTGDKVVGVGDLNNILTTWGTFCAPESSK